MNSGPAPNPPPPFLVAPGDGAPHLPAPVPQATGAGGLRREVVDHEYTSGILHGSGGGG